MHGFAVSVDSVSVFSIQHDDLDVILFELVNQQSVAVVEDWLNTESSNQIHVLCQF